MGGELQWQQCDAQGQAKDVPKNPSTLINDIHGERGRYGWVCERGSDNERIPR